MIYLYSAFGLCIKSEIELRELMPEPDANKIVDLHIRKANVIPELKALGEVPPSMDFENPDGVFMIWPGAAAIRIKDLSNIYIQGYPGVSERYMAFPLLGPVMGWILHQRGSLVLHSSAVRLDGHSIAFLGDKRAGKSTTAAAFIKNGADLITDDLLVINMKNSQQPMIQPSFAQIKLNEDASHRVDIPDSDALPLVIPNFPKRQYRLKSMVTQDVPCGAFFIIRREGETPKIEWADAGSGFQHLMRYSYNVRFYTAPISTQKRERHFKQCVELANSSKIGILSIPQGINELEETVQVVRKAMVDIQS